MPAKQSRPHIIDGHFQSDKYPLCPRGKVPLSVEDPTAQDLLWEYAQRRRSVDAEFSSDLEFALEQAGYGGAAEESEASREARLYRAVKPIDCPNCGIASVRRIVDDDNTHNAWSCATCGYLDDDEDHLERPGPSEAEVAAWSVAILENIVERCNKDGDVGRMVVGFSSDQGGNSLTLLINDSHTHVGGAAAFSVLVRSLHRWLVDEKGLSLAIRVEDPDAKPLHEADPPGKRPLIVEMMELIEHAMAGRSKGFDYDEWMKRAEAAQTRYAETRIADAGPLK